MIHRIVNGKIVYIQKYSDILTGIGAGRPGMTGRVPQKGGRAFLTGVFRDSLSVHQS
jgi:hypothetical protein